jgi:tripartite-type tricarboxylate transporter receptor subunit TctC
MEAEMKLWKHLAVCLSAILLTGAVGHADDYPTRPIKFVVPFAAGSATDAVARIIGEKVSATLKQPVVVENMAGASGVLAAQNVARAAPDGYTILITTNTTHGANQSLLARVPYDALNDFEPITRLAGTQLVLLVTPSLPVNSVSELIAHARANPGKLTFGSGSSSSRVCGELLKMRANIDIAHVPYRSIPPSVTDVISGQISMAFADPQSGLPQVQAGKAKALAVSGTTRLKLAPDLPTMQEAGVPNYDITAWFAAFAPAKTPKRVIDTLHKALSDAANDPVVGARLVAVGIDPTSSSPEELRNFVVAEIKKWAEIVQAAGIKPE